MKTRYWLYAALACGVVAAPLTMWAQNGAQPPRQPAQRLPPMSQPSAETPEPLPRNSQPPASPNAQPPTPAAPAPGLRRFWQSWTTGEKPTQDPTTVRPELRPLLDPPEGADRAPLPTVQLKARIVMPDGKAAGIIEMDGQTFTVQPGSKLTAAGATLEVKAITATHALVRWEELDRTIQIR